MPCHPPSEEGQPPRGGRKGEGASGSRPGGRTRIWNFFKGESPGVCTRPPPAEERSSMKRPPGGPTVATTKQQEESLVAQQ